MNYKYYEFLIVKKLMNEISHSEDEELTCWLAESKTNRQSYEEYLVIWNNSSLLWTVPDSRRVYENIVGLLSLNRKSNITSGSIFRKQNWMKAAAIVLFCVLSVSYIVNTKEKQNTTASADIVVKHNLKGRKSLIRLPDGSLVKLNADSYLTYSLDFEQERIVELKGEAYFEVRKNKSKPFIVKLDEIEVHVLGTSFNIHSFNTDQETVVAVKSGEVKIVNDTLKPVLITRLELAVYNASTATIKKQTSIDEDLIFGWTQQRLVFKEHDLNKVFEKLSNWFGVEFEISQPLDMKRKFTANYPNPSLREVMESLSYAYNFNYEVNGKNIIIS